MEAISKTKVSSRYQTVIPAWVRKSLNIDANTEIVWMSFKPGEITVQPAPNKEDKESFADSIAGILKDDSWDSLEELKKYKMEDKELEKRGLLDD